MNISRAAPVLRAGPGSGGGPAPTGKVSLPGIEARPGLLSIGAAYRWVTALSFPPRFPIIQFPNLPLALAFVAGWTAGALSGQAHSYAQAVSYLAMTVWAYEELAHGVNWFRRLLGLAFVIILIVRVAHAISV
jgi:hypothetical protein